MMHSIALADNKKQRYTLRFLLPATKVGVIIGKGGAHIKATRNISNARVNIGDEIPGCDRIVTIFGSMCQVQVAYTHIIDLLAAAAANRSNDGTSGIPLANSQGEMVLVLLLPSKKIGCIIGIGGRTIAYIRESSGANIKVATQEETPGYAGASDRTVKVTGSRQAVNRAQRIIISLINNNACANSLHAAGINMNMNINNVCPRSRSESVGVIGFKQHSTLTHDFPSCSPPSIFDRPSSLLSKMNVNDSLRECTYNEKQNNFQNVHKQDNRGLEYFGNIDPNPNPILESLGSDYSSSKFFKTVPGTSRSFAKKIPSFPRRSLDQCSTRSRGTDVFCESCSSSSSYLLNTKQPRNEPVNGSYSSSFSSQSKNTDQSFFTTGVTRNTLNARRNSLNIAMNTPLSNVIQSEDSCLVLTVSDKYAGKLIGFRGSCIKEMRAISGADIEINRRPEKQNSQMRNIGTFEQIQMARYLIGSKVKEYSEQQNSQNIFSRQY